MNGKLIFQLLICFLLLTCQTKSGKRIKERLAIGLAARASGAGFESDIHHFKVKTERILAQNDSIIANFRCRLEVEQKETNPYYKKQVAKLEKKNQDLKKRVKQYKTTQKKEWENFKEQISEELADLGQEHRELRLRNTHPDIVCK